MDIDVTSPKEQRNFGLTVTALCVVFCAAGWWRHGEIRTWLLVVAALFLAPALVAPGLLRPILAFWLRIAEFLNWAVTHVILTLCFWCMITPVRFVIRWFGTDPLQRRWEPGQTSYWEEPDAQPSDLEAYKNQF